MILYLKDVRDYTIKLSELIDTFSKVAGCKVNMQKATAFLYADDKYVRKKSGK
jgi:hypothetical protein